MSRPVKDDVGNGVVAPAEAAETEPVTLTENFFISNKKRQPIRIQVCLNATGIFLRRDTTVADHVNEQLLRIEDIAGSFCGPQQRKRRHRGSLMSCRSATNDADADTDAAQRTSKDPSAYLYVYAYPRVEKPLRRERTVRILRFRSADDYEENLRTAGSWHAGIRTNQLRQQRLHYTAQRPLLVLLNPKSGAGHGREMFQKQVAPLLREAETPYELLVTTHENHARELVRRRQDLAERYAAIAVASGDGLLYEVLNGIMERRDWRAVTQQLPLGIVPCGSGNGLARSIAHLYGEPYEPKPVLGAALTCLSGNYAPMDVVRVETTGGDICYSFLSIGWGLMADIDIESERLRKIGATRFTLWSIHRVLSLRSYKATLYYLPWRPDMAITPPRNRTAPSAATTGTRVDGDAFQDLADSYSAQGSDEFQDVLSIGRPRDSWHSAYSKRTAYYSMDGGGQSMAGSQRSAAAQLSRRIDNANAAWEAAAATDALTSSLPPLAESLSNRPEWLREEGDYILVHTASTTHIASDLLFAPDSRLNDGIIYLVIIRQGIPRSQLVNFLLSMSDGSHLPLQPHEYIRVLQVRAFRIEPAVGEGSPPGIITVDGERVKYGSIQCEVFPGLINALVPHAK